MAEHNETGKAGEAEAAGWLRRNGYQILEMNWRFLTLEADIIARKDNLLVIAEVKTRTSGKFGEPQMFVNRRKQQNLVRAANAYLQRSGLDLEVRFDILAVIRVNGTSSVTHIEEAFYPLVNRNSR